MLWKLCALDPVTANVRWIFSAQRDNSNTKPCVGRGKVFFTSSDYHCYALLPDDGSILWKYNARGSIYSFPSLCGDRLVIGDEKGVLTCLNADTGALVWEKELGMPLSRSPVICGDIMIASGCDGLFALRSRR